MAIPARIRKNEDERKKQLKLGSTIPSTFFPSVPSGDFLRRRIRLIPHTDTHTHTLIRLMIAFGIFVLRCFVVPLFRPRPFRTLVLAGERKWSYRVTWLPLRAPLAGPQPERQTERPSVPS